MTVYVKHKENSMATQHLTVRYLAQAVATKLNIANTKTAQSERREKERWTVGNHTTSWQLGEMENQP
jgi:hypothetical protein